MFRTKKRARAGGPVWRAITTNCVPSGVQTAPVMCSELPDVMAVLAEGSSKMLRAGSVPSRGTTHTDSGRLACGVALRGVCWDTSLTSAADAIVMAEFNRHDVGAETIAAMSKPPTSASSG
jgi:hypothetical protein